MRIYIDVGHGVVKEDSGATVVSGGVNRYESRENLKIAKQVYTRLTQAGHTVTASRESEVNTGDIVGKYNRADSNLINSANRVKNNDYDFMISIHCDSSDNKSAKGAVLVNKPDTTSRNLKNSLEKHFKAYTNVGVCYTNENYTSYGILRLHDKPGVLVECGFMTNETNLHEILCNYNKIGDTIADALLEVIGEIESTTHKVTFEELVADNASLMAENLALKNEVIALNKKINSIKTELNDFMQSTNETIERIKQTLK